MTRADHLVSIVGFDGIAERLAQIEADAQRLARTEDRDERMKLAGGIRGDVEAALFAIEFLRTRLVPVPRAFPDFNNSQLGAIENG